MLDTVRNRPVTDTANSPASARKSPLRSTASAPGSRSRRRRKMNTPASTSTAAMSRAWKIEPADDALGVELQRCRRATMYTW